MVDEVGVWLGQARRLVGQRNVEAAAGFYRQVLTRTEHPEALLHMSFMAAREGRYREGREYLLRAFAAGVGQAPNLVAGLVNRLRFYNETARMRAWLAEASFLADVRDPQLLVMISAQLSWLGEQEEAIRYVDKAIGLAPRAAQLHLARAQMYLFLGRFEEAERGVMQCLRLAPDRGEAWWTLAGLRKWTAEENHVDQMRKALASPGQSRVDQANLHYALHLELDALGDIPAAFAAMEAACKLRKADQPYDRDRLHAVFARLKSVRWPTASGVVPDDFTPVFVVGMHRSGTTLLEQLIGKSDKVVSGGELHDVASSMRYAVDHAYGWSIDDVVLDRLETLDFSEVGRHYVEGVRWRLGDRSHLTDKWPPNHANVGFICQAMPHARLVHITRDPVETCFSNLREMFGGAAPYTYDQVELADYYKQYRGLMDHWNAVFPGRILNIHYDDLTRDTEATMRKVATFCGLEYTDAMLSPKSDKSVATASVVQVRNEVVVRKTPKWVPYEPYLQPLISGLQG